jgi:hypothetical protein
MGTVPPADNFSCFMPTTCCPCLPPAAPLQAQKRYPLVAGGGSDGSAEQQTKRVHVFGKQ